MKQLLQERLELTKVKLVEAKPRIKLFGLDYDGTIYDGADYKLPQVFALVEKILAKDKSVAFITARAATALKTLVPPLHELLAQKNISIPNFIAGGNGTTLYEVKKDGLVEIYNHGLGLPQIKCAVDVGRKVYEKLEINRDDLSEKGLETFQKFLKEDWTGYIPPEIVDVCRPFEGEIFTEEAKVTFVLPKDKTLHKKIVKNAQTELGKNYSIAAGDETFIHITKRLGEDSKTVAIKTILNFLGLKENQVATFGDMPNGNDAGLLSFPYSFTNSEEFVKIKKNLQQPPFVLMDSDTAPVGRVYKAIDYLLS